MYVELTDDFVLVRPYKYGYYEVYSGSIRADKKRDSIDSGDRLLNSRTHEPRLFYENQELSSLSPKFSNSLDL